MSVFLTGATGYLGSYVAHRLLTEHDTPLTVLVRASDAHAAHERLWKAWQLHFPSFDGFATRVAERVTVVCGDLVAPRFGLAEREHAALAERITSVLHIAASLNRKSSKECFNVNLRGTLEVIKLARAAHDDHGLRRFSEVSTVAVAGTRAHECVSEDACVDWDRSDYDPYGRTKKFCEHMAHELLADVPRTIFRPATVLGDSRFAETTQFDMVRAFVFLAGLPALPLDPRWRMDIVPADYVGDAIATVHELAAPPYDTYHLSSGEAANTYAQIGVALREARGGRPMGYAPALARPFGWLASAVGDLRRKHPVVRGAALLKVFWPYLTYDTVFDNRRIVEVLGREPVPFIDYAGRLYRFAVDGRFTYPYRPWPEGARLADPLGVARRGRARRAPSAARRA